MAYSLKGQGHDLFRINTLNTKGLYLLTLSGNERGYTYNDMIKSEVFQPRLNKENNVVLMFISFKC